MGKAITKNTKKKTKAVIEPEVVGNVEEKEEVAVKESVSVNELVAGTLPDYVEQKYSIKLDNKKIDGRTKYEVISILEGAMSGVSKIVIEQD